MPPALRTYAQHIEDLLAEYQQAGHGKICSQKLDPKPDSDAEDSARLDGVEGQATSPFGGDKIYMGLSSACWTKSGHSVASARPRTVAGIRHLPRHRARGQSHAAGDWHHERVAGIRFARLIP